MSGTSTGRSSVQAGPLPEDLPVAQTGPVGGPIRSERMSDQDTQPISWSRRSLLSLAELSAQELRTILGTAAGFDRVSKRSVKKAPALRGRVVANLFFEDSTRTRLSFTLAAQRLSADTIDLTGPGSSASKGETIIDTALNVEAMGVDALVVRHSQSGAPAMIADRVRCAVVNAGDGKHEHPTQGLLDVYTLARSMGRVEGDGQGFDLAGLRVAIVGDITSSRVARSNIAALTKLGAQVVCVGPPTLAPASLRSLGCEVCHDFDEVIDSGVDAVNMLRIQFERHGQGGAELNPKAEGDPSRVAGSGSPAFPSLREYVRGYGLTRERADRLKEGAIVMHPGPMNRGVEIAGEVADGERSVILQQVTGGLAVRMAVLYLCVGSAG